MRSRRLVQWLVLVVVLVTGLPVVAPLRPGTNWLLDLAIDFDSPDAVATFMLHRFSFRHDRELYGVAERFVPPKEFLARGAGDCDDWAWFAAEALLEHGYKSWLVSVWRDRPDEAGNSGHMVAAYLARDGWGYVSTEGHVAAHAESLAGLAETVASDWAAVSVWTYTGLPARPSPWNGWRPAARLRKAGAPRLPRDFRDAEQRRLQFRDPADFPWGGEADRAGPAHASLHPASRPSATN